MIVPHDLDNAEHEILHCFVNPIAAEIASKLSSEELQKIIDLAPDSLKIDRGYGEHAESLLAEQLIRKYQSFFRDKKAPVERETFLAELKKYSDENLQKTFENNEMLHSNCESMGIENSKEFRIRAEEYFERFVRDDLGVFLYQFWKKFSFSPDGSCTESLEKFLHENLN
ncbi:hypothetical protein HN954_01440 [bacterium]|nr:hypothetical protein [bacterium]MBT6832404.1 hypothetical protein [bacterium]MBT6996075.1 hypothetical protein [bacterium]MBT7772524.1 hypothetical protein [bacterium]